MYQVVALEQTNPCPKCDSQKWMINNLGNQNCGNCGYICSLGFITYEDEVFSDSENTTKNLSRFSQNDGKLDLGKSFSDANKIDENKKKQNNKKVEKEEYLLLLFSKCIKLMPYYTPKEIFYLRQSFIQEWNNNEDNKTNEFTQAFAYHYFFNEWRQYFNIDQQEYLQISLKKTLDIELTIRVKSVTLENQLSNMELYYQLIKQFYPQLSEQQFNNCLDRLEYQRCNVIGCKITQFCVYTYDTLLNYLQCQVDIKEIISIAHKIFNTRETEIQEQTVTRVYKQFIKKTTSSKPKYSN